MKFNFREWARERGLEDVYNDYVADVEAIQEECEEDGYPGNGNNFELKVESLKESYPELFPELFEEN